MLRRDQLIPGKMYTLWGRKNTFPISMYVGTNIDELLLMDTTLLWPLEAFVFLGMQQSKLISYPDEPWFLLNIINRSGIVGWIYVHDEDFAACQIGFNHAKDLSKP